MTSKQHELLEYIKKTIRETGVSPTYREMSKHMGLTSPQGSFSIVAKLMRDGYLENTPGCSRTIRLTAKTPNYCKHCGEQL